MTVQPGSEQGKTLAANISLSVLLVLVLIAVVQYLQVPQQLDSPLIPAYVADVIRKPLLIKGSTLIVILVLCAWFRRAGRMTPVIVCGITGLAFELTFPYLWMLFTQSGVYAL